MQYLTDEHFIYLSGFDRNDMLLLNGIETKKGFRFPKNIWVYRELYRHFPKLRENKEFINDGKRVGTRSLASYNEFPKLRVYQNEDASKLVHWGNALVLNEQRTGKTPMILSVLNVLQPRRTLIVTPASLTFNWKKEVETWCDKYTQPYVFSGTPKQKVEAIRKFLIQTACMKNILIISKDTLKSNKEIQNWNFDCVIVDEAHYLRNTKTTQSKAVLGLQATHKFALTGTPVVKHDSDIYGLMKFLNPKAYPSFWQFVERYFHIDDTYWGKELGKIKQEREEEFKGIVNQVSVMRKRKDVMKWLPKAQHQTIPLVMESKQEKLYKQMLETFEATEGDIEIDTQNVLTQLIRLRQLCLEPALLGFDCVSAKTKALLEFAENNDEPFIVMTMYSSYFDIIKPLLEKLGKKVGVIRGSISQKEKFKTAEDFQNGHYDILLCNIISAGTGFTLDRSETMVFLDKSFSPSDNAQAKDRIVPVSEERNHNINIISFVIADSVDERVNEIIEQKLNMTDLIRTGKFKLK